MRGVAGGPKASVTSFLVALPPKKRGSSRSTVALPFWHDKQQVNARRGRRAEGERYLFLGRFAAEEAGILPLDGGSPLLARQAAGECAAWPAGRRRALPLSWSLCRRRSGDPPARRWLSPSGTTSSR